MRAESGGARVRHLFAIRSVEGLSLCESFYLFSMIIIMVKNTASFSIESL